MTRTALIAITLLSSLATPVVVGATGGSPSAQVTQHAGAVQVAPEANAANSAPCLRRVKIVYAGYGEGERAACPVPALDLKR